MSCMYECILPLLFLTVIKTQCLDSSAVTVIVTHTTTRVPGTYINVCMYVLCITVDEHDNT